jgi:hypothetical protein
LFRLGMKIFTWTLSPTANLRRHSRSSPRR